MGAFHGPIRPLPTVTVPVFFKQVLPGPMQVTTMLAPHGAALRMVHLEPLPKLLGTAERSYLNQYVEGVRARGYDISINPILSRPYLQGNPSINEKHTCRDQSVYTSLRK